MLDNKYFEPYFKGTNFGTTEYVDLIMKGLLNVACHYHNGMTMHLILMENGLITVTGKLKTRKLTSKGGTYLYRLLEQKKVI